jgi:N-acetylglucosaminyldiphosphoundecaprenol N-acetyl-beta-D-mannosaminyltransferase
MADNSHHPRPAVGEVRFDALTRWEAATHVRDELVRGRGGRLVVLSHEQLRHLADTPLLRTRLDAADLVLAGSATAVWASRLAGTPLPERITASGLSDALCAACNVDGRLVYLVGGAPATICRTIGRLATLRAVPPDAHLPSAAARAAAVIGVRHQGLRVAGCPSATTGVADDATVLATVIDDVVAAKPDVVLIGVEDAAAEETLVQAVRAELAASWVFGSVGLIQELAGDHPTHRGGRHVHVSYAAKLLARAAASRVSGRRPSR